jgi:hypothetical protein
MSALFVAWRSGANDAGVWGPVGRLDYDGEVFRFCYTRGARTLPGFRPFPGMDNLNRVYRSNALFPLFANRLLPPSRPEYAEFLCWGGFDPNDPPDPIVVLGVTGGERATDSIEVFPCPAPDECGYYLHKFFLHGVRWMPPSAVDRIQRLQKDEPLLLMPDLCNHFDPRAVAVRTESERTLIGYVPRYLANDIGQLLQGCCPESIQVTVERVNRHAPLQQLLLCRMHSCWPVAFTPCGGEDFLPIPSDVPVKCEM